MQLKNHCAKIQHTPFSFLLVPCQAKGFGCIDSFSIFTIIQEPEELFETISQALLASVDRDCLSGWGGHVYVV